eukprot:TRINITY_DN48623_c0_g1_i1.p1 TRINITY_DN48623_c0_g1~~TRINITY_DN48623_c0_g1_i1.p1  ORF type:complete len:575 (-),score=90.81 TRINITY_DN48623_c0_g1_i1:186-1910(-)
MGGCSPSRESKPERLLQSGLSGGCCFGGFRSWLAARRQGLESPREAAGARHSCQQRLCLRASDCCDGARRWLSGAEGRSPVYQHVIGHCFVYFWDDRDGDTWSGWWLGPTVGSATVWAHCPSTLERQSPPWIGWQVPWDGPPVYSVRFRTASSSSSSRSSSCFAALRRSPAAACRDADCKQVKEPEWTKHLAPPSAPLQQEETENLLCCGICLEPLWDSEPCVFLVNLSRLCPHYFCRHCAQRLVGEATTVVRILCEGLQLTVEDRLPVVLDREGNQIGDLVWRMTGNRVTEGELAVIQNSLERLSAPEEGMELRFEAGKAEVLRNMELVGELLRATARSLRHITQEEFDAQHLGGVIKSDQLQELQANYLVLSDSGQPWTCERCTIANPPCEFQCILCWSPPPRPKQPLGPSRLLSASEANCLRRRFAVRPRITWAADLQCPLCRAKGCASLTPLPDLREAPSTFFRLADLSGEGQIPAAELARALAATLPVGVDRLRHHLEGAPEQFPATDAPPCAPKGLTLAEFVQEGGLAHWGARHRDAVAAVQRSCAPASPSGLLIPGLQKGNGTAAEQ